MNDTKTTLFNIRISEQDKSRLLHLANQDGRSMSNYIINLIRKESEKTAK